MTPVEPAIRAPKLQVGRTGAVSRLELFFDLAYVLVIIELVSAFTKDVSWHGLLVLVGLFATIWFSWVGFTLFGNRFDNDDVLFRLGQLAGTLSIAGCAASASEAVGKYAVPFAASYLLGRVVLFLFHLRAWRSVPEGRATVEVYLVTTGASAVAWAVSLGVDGGWRYGLWALGVLVGALGPLLATFRKDSLPLHIEHLPERFALLVILVLGEAVGGATHGVHDMEWAAMPVVLGVVGFVLAGAMWWIYFGVAEHISTRELERADPDETAEEEEARTSDADSEGPDSEGPDSDGPDAEGTDSEGTDSEGTDSEGTDADERHDAFIYGHLPLTLGIVLVGVGIEEQILHPESAATNVDWLLAGGLLLFLLGVAVIVGGTVRRWRSIWPWPLVGVPLVALLAVIPHSSALLLLGAFAVVLVGVAILGAQRRRRDRAA